MSYLSAILAAFVILSCPPGDFLEGLTYFEDSPREAKVYFGGNEYIGGMPVGSVLYIFDRKTDKFIGLRVKVTFDEDLKETFAEEGRFQPGQGFWVVKGPPEDAELYFNAVYRFFSEQFVILPSMEYADTSSRLAAWDLPEYKAEITLMEIDGILTLTAGVTEKS